MMGSEVGGEVWDNCSGFVILWGLGGVRGSFGGGVRWPDVGWRFAYPTLYLSCIGDGIH